MRRNDKCCGGCIHMTYEASDGWGWCNVGDNKTYCGYGNTCDDYEDEETIRRHHIAVLVQYQRCYKHVFETNSPYLIYRKPKDEDISKAIDYAINQLKG